MATRADFTQLDNPIWNSLATCHAGFAIASAGNLARRYPESIGPLSGLCEATPAAFAELATLLPQGEAAVLFLDSRSSVPADWDMIRDGRLVQMVCAKLVPAPPIVEPIVPLGPADWPEMLALATLTVPGPFREQTALLGRFVGVRVDGRLVAMAGQRLAPTGFSEVSAVCTDPAFRGHGFARALMTEVTRGILQDGLTPFLTAFETNLGAIRIYQHAGFDIRRHLELAVANPPAA